MGIGETSGAKETGGLEVRRSTGRRRFERTRRTLVPRSPQSLRPEGNGAYPTDSHSSSQATRNPAKVLIAVGSPLSRAAERQNLADSCHEPPRSTRASPLDGPWGSVTFSSA